MNIRSMKNFSLLLTLPIVLLGASFFFWKNQSSPPAEQSSKKSKNGLSALQEDILYRDGTERPFTSDLLHEKRKGTYYAVDTKTPVFRSEDKFDSGTGWPSFTKPITPDAVQEKQDTSLFGMERTAIASPSGGHLGHVFPDGPKPTGLRYCINGVVLYFIPDEE